MSGAAPEPITHVTVVVPARDEERLITRCLTSIAVAREHLRITHPTPVDVRVIVVLDRCSDGTEYAAQSAGVDVVSVDAGSVGAARRIGMTRALSNPTAHHLSDQHSPVRPPARRHWLLSTDADSAVPVEWLHTHVELAAGGAQVVAGLVRPDDCTAPQVLSRWHAAHPIHLGHDQIYGANLGIRADTYLLVGGFPAVDTGEDRYLVNAARAIGARIVATDRGTVTTSGRLDGRAPAGFAAWLRQS